MICRVCVRSIETAPFYIEDTGICQECFNRSCAGMDKIDKAYHALIDGGVDNATANKIMVAYIDSEGEGKRVKARLVIRL